MSTARVAVFVACTALAAFAADPTTPIVTSAASPQIGITALNENPTDGSF
jgi:hypothetical protein